MVSENQSAENSRRWPVHGWPRCSWPLF